MSDTTPLEVLQSWAAARGGPVAPLVPALQRPDDAVDRWLGSEDATFFVRLLLHQSFADLQAALEGEEPLPSARWLALARHDPRRFLWLASPDAVLGEPLGPWRELLLPHLEEAELSAALPWLRHPSFLPAEDARERLEARLRGAGGDKGWYALAQAMDALRQRGFAWQASRSLADLLDRAWVDDREARAVEGVARDFMSLRLLLTMARHTPWRDDPERLAGLAERVDTEGLGRILLADPPLLADVPRAGDLQLVAWRLVSNRPDADALDTSARMLAVQGDLPVGRAGGIEAVLALQRLHGERSVPPLVHAFLVGLHRTPQGDVLERWLARHPRRALVAALDDPPPWQPSFDPGAMRRLAFRLVPRLDDAGRAAVSELADVVGGPRGEMVLAEL